MEALNQKIPGPSRRVPAQLCRLTICRLYRSHRDAQEILLPQYEDIRWHDDPTDHIASYKQRMFTVNITWEQRKACMCKSFGSSLQGIALQWYTNLANNSISSFAQLTNTFVEQFASSKKLEKLLGDLYLIQQ